jgi:carbon-monoxide dehydrogenase medium subunit
MIPAAFEYTRPATIDEAIAAVGGGAKIIAGGQSILPLLKLRLAAADKLVDIGRIQGLKGYRTMPDGGVEIGALTTYAEWQAATTMPSVAEAIDLIADVQVRNRGTVGGSIAHADPASDLPAIALAFDGSAVLRGPAGERVVPLDGFFQSAFTIGMAPDEILVAIRRPAVPDGAQFAYRKLANPASGYSIVGVAAVIGRGGDGRINHARVALTGVHEHPYRASEVEAALVGSDGSSEAVAAAAQHATVDVEVNSDIHADAAYRAAMAVIYTKRAIEGALGR